MSKILEELTERLNNAEDLRELVSHKHKHLIQFVNSTELAVYIKELDQSITAIKAAKEPPAKGNSGVAQMLHDTAKEYLDFYGKRGETK